MLRLKSLPVVVLAGTVRLVHYRASLASGQDSSVDLLARGASLAIWEAVVNLLSP
jgi:hypothetical protein